MTAPAEALFGVDPLVIALVMLTAALLFLMPCAPLLLALWTMVRREGRLEVEARAEFVRAQTERIHARVELARVRATSRATVGFRPDGAPPSRGPASRPAPAP